MTDTTTKQPQQNRTSLEEKLSPLVEMALVLMVKMREYIEIYARDVHATDTQLYKDAITKLEKAIDDIASLFGLKGSMLIMSKQLGELNEMYRTQPSNAANQQAAAQLQQQPQHPAQQQPTSTQQTDTKPTTDNTPDQQTSATTMPELKETADEIASAPTIQTRPVDTSTPQTSTTSDTTGQQQPQEQPEEKTEPSVPNLDELNSLLAELEKQAKGQQNQ